MLGFPLDHLVALAGFAFVACFSPGPNNIMLMTSGVNYGFRATVPHMLGIILGFPVLMIAVGLGLGAVFEAYPVMATVLKWLGAAYLLYLAWRIANAAAPDAARTSIAKPMSFLAAAAFQWVNPKAWMMSISAVATYSIVGQHIASVAMIALIFSLVSTGVTSSWTLFGVTLRQILRDDKWRRVFNIAMALMLVATLIPIMTGAI